MTHGDHTQDHERVQNEVATTDQGTTVRRVVSALFGVDLAPAGGRPAGYQSDFEGRELNAMIDLVEHATPSELTSAGEALLNARDAINDAAKELRGHIGTVDWHGESGTAFRKWGDQLVTNTQALAKFAGEAGDPIQVGHRLTSVKSSMPPRDHRAEKKTVKQIPVPAQIKGNPEYDAAVQVEGHRQEAINQMTRLASFYSVASGNLASQEPPKFEMMPDVGVPKTTSSGAEFPRKRSSTGQLGTASSQGSTSHAKGEVSTRLEAELVQHGKIDELRPHDVTTEIDSAPPIVVAPPIEPAPTPSPNPPGPTPNPTPPYADGFVKTGQNTPPKAFGRTTTPQGRDLTRQATGGSKSPNPNQAGRTPTTGMGRGAGHPWDTDRPTRKGNRPCRHIRRSHADGALRRLRWYPACRYACQVVTGRCRPQGRCRGRQAQHGSGSRIVLPGPARHCHRWPQGNRWPFSGNRWQGGAARCDRGSEVHGEQAAADSADARRSRGCAR